MFCFFLGLSRSMSPFSVFSRAPLLTLEKFFKLSFQVVRCPQNGGGALQFIQTLKYVGSRTFLVVFDESRPGRARREVQPVTFYQYLAFMGTAAEMERPVVRHFYRMIRTEIAA